MNKTILREAGKCGFKIRNNFITYNSAEIDINKFLSEVIKLQFTHSLKESLRIVKSNFLNRIEIGDNIL